MAATEPAAAGILPGREVKRGSWAGDRLEERLSRGGGGGVHVSVLGAWRAGTGAGGRRGAKELYCED